VFAILKLKPPTVYLWILTPDRSINSALRLLYLSLSSLVGPNSRGSLDQTGYSCYRPILQTVEPNYSFLLH